MNIVRKFCVYGINVHFHTVWLLHSVLKFSFINITAISESEFYSTLSGDGQKTDPQSMDYPDGLPKWTTPKKSYFATWELPGTNNIKNISFYPYNIKS